MIISKTMKSLLGTTLAGVALAAGLAISNTAVAGPLAPISYDMDNGNSGAYNYWDQIYTGTGSTTTDGAALTGGLGDLTDGVIASSNWNIAEAPAGNGPYVGWVNKNPTITFNFGTTVWIDSVTLYLDDANLGGVLQPGSVDINGNNYVVTDPTPGDFLPFGITFSGLNATGSTLTLQLFRQNSWVFLSEVEFDGHVVSSAIPEPGPLRPRSCRSRLRTA
jgi:hypothetical protein